MATYPREGASEVPAQPDFPELEQRALAYWNVHETFKESIEHRDEASEFVFYDGPPFANGLPHYGHLLTGYVKDIVPRYKTMRGYKVDRRFGWDTHGLPAEVEAERLLGISGKADILKMGIDTFNQECRDSVLRYTKEWEEYVTRQARWVDFEHDYKTLDLPYMESVMWAFKQLHDKGLIYQGFKVLPYCWRCETPLANHELRMDDDVYADRTDPSVTVRFKLETGEWILAWTTTPWTLPSNLAVAVGPDITYVTVETENQERYILAEARLKAYEKELGEHRKLNSFRGEELLGRRYQPLFDYLTDTGKYGTQSAWRIIPSDEVTTEDGTGVVHKAPAYGESDAADCQAAGIPIVLTVDDQGRYLPVISDWAGMHVFEANKPVIARLRQDGALVRREDYTHSYPHCWRCRNPLIYKAVSSWFVEVTKFRDRMVELNEQITWVPEHVKHGQFGKWLSNARDWSISRNRFWGSPIPVWQSDDPDYPRTDVYGSLDELERDFAVRPADLHRPGIDNLTRPNPDDPTGKSTMRRVPEVLDCWFESGSMPFAQVHYPFENRDWFDRHYPGDFIVEYIGQTRGWFYTLHVLATALFDRPSFRSCVSHGIVLGNDGRKMSKSLRNYPDVNEVFNTYGSDAMRWFLMASPILRGGNLVVTTQGIREGVRQALLPLWNSYYFFALYANAENYTASGKTDSGHVLDRYILAKTRTTVEDMGQQLDAFNIPGACQTLRDYLELLTNWYIRRSRSRFWEGNTAALDTLWTVLETVTRAAAPLLPMTAETIWRGLTGGTSVHLEDWPDVADWPSDAALADTMDLTRNVCSAALSLRKARQLRVRLPLAALTVAHGQAPGLAEFADIIKDEVNVKDLVLSGDPASLGQFQLTVNPRALGPRLGQQVQEVIKAVKAGQWTRDGDVVVAAGAELQPGEYELKLTAADPDSTTALPGSDGLIALNVTVTPELEAEGTARDVIRVVQQARRDAGLDVSDRITLVVGADAQVAAAVRAHAAFIATETLATELTVVPAAEVTSPPQPVGDGGEVRVSVSKSLSGTGGCSAVILEAAATATVPTGIFVGEGWKQAGELGAALLLSGAIGVEREIRQKNAGLRTHTLVGLGAALFMLISKYGFNDVLTPGVIILDPSRMAAQIVSGIGFIGAGLIFVRRDSVRGLTTAASVWVTAAVGAAAGAGLVLIAAETTAVYLVLVAGAFRVLTRHLPRSSETTAALRIRYLDGRGVLRRVLQAATRRGFIIDELSAESLSGRALLHPGARDAGPADPMVEVTLRVHGKTPVSDLAAALSEIDDVASVLVGEDPERDD